MELAAKPGVAAAGAYNAAVQQASEMARPESAFSQMPHCVPQYKHKARRRTRLGRCCCLALCFRSRSLPCLPSPVLACIKLCIKLPGLVSRPRRAGRILSCVLARAEPLAACWQLWKCWGRRRRRGRLAARRPEQRRQLPACPTACRPGTGPQPSADPRAQSGSRCSALCFIALHREAACMVVR